MDSAWLNFLKITSNEKCEEDVMSKHWDFRSEMAEMDRRHERNQKEAIENPMLTKGEFYGNRPVSDVVHEHKRLYQRYKSLLEGSSGAIKRYIVRRVLSDIIDNVDKSEGISKKEEVDKDTLSVSMTFLKQVSFVKR